MLSRDKKISLRLEEIRNALSLGKGEMAEKLGVYPQDYSKFFPTTNEGESKRKPETLVVELLSLGVNAHWYLTGKGRMFVHEIHEASEMDIENDDVLKQEARKIQLLFDRGLINIGGKKEETFGMVAEGPEKYSTKTASIPVYSHAIAAGPATDSTCPVEESLDLPRHMINHPSKTYAVRATGDSMIGAGIEEGDILIVDRAVEPINKNIVIASINGEQTVKRLWIDGGNIKLMPENHNYEPIEVQKGMDFRTQGVVTWVIRKTG